ncbi:U2 snRNP component IST3 [Yarrowia sp. C11]|nr:U2 snRNP component IST3 [Yarrowia sp. E02]KAG5365300.1 U2 snRNP component IST3 [Yarrowia sp. C11]
MNAIRKTIQINNQELAEGTSISASWHNDYNDTAYIYIGGLESKLTELDIATVFSQFGNPTHVKLSRDPKTGKSRGFAWLKYEDQRSTVLAVDNFNGVELLGRTVRVDHTYYESRDEEGDAKEVDMLARARDQRLGGGEKAREREEKSRESGGRSREDGGRRSHRSSRDRSRDRSPERRERRSHRSSRSSRDGEERSRKTRERSRDIDDSARDDDRKEHTSSRKSREDGEGSRRDDKSENSSRRSREDGGSNRSREEGSRRSRDTDDKSRRSRDDDKSRRTRDSERRSRRSRDDSREGRRKRSRRERSRSRDKSRVDDVEEAKSTKPSSAKVDPDLVDPMAAYFAEKK